MTAIAHHLTAVYVFAACVLVPLLVVGLWRFMVRRQYRKAQEAMRRGNQLHRNWLESSKPVDGGPRGN
ncbi:hypothetical protein [Pseudorhodoferax sp.]|uniref:hypothetical protein n=1 Tax=Pseudorhodoferax sp. TaxID=1993553 RepID=UPI002DD64FF2|nr:hypothetical protein [Pseudorhodoferax sp.]